MHQKIVLQDYLALPEGHDQYPFEFIENRKVIKLLETATEVHIAMVFSDDLVLQSELRFFHDKALTIFEISQEDLTEYLGKKIGEAGGSAFLGKQDDRHQVDKLAEDAPIVNLVNNILLEGIRLGASDLHFEAFERTVHIRYRIDGVLRIGRTLDRDVFSGISSRLKVMANLNIIEKRLPQDGRLSVSMGERQVEFRISIVPTQEGESIVLRMFQRKELVSGLDQLGFTAHFLESFRRAGSHANGLILVTGPTGSGKTTSLNALLHELNSSERKILTVEDPVENLIEGINQVQTNETIGLTFDSILRRLLRQDPDIMMIGEIRDKKTAELAVRSALTGHLVLSTLHTNDALSAIPRLVNMGIESYLLGGVLRAVSAQRLLRKICPVCRESYTPGRTDLQFLARFEVSADALWRGVGCKECNQTGFKGRIAIGEIFEINEEVEELVVSGAGKSVLLNHFKQAQAPFMIDSGISAILEGQSTIVELERAVLLTV